MVKFTDIPTKEGSVISTNQFHSTFSVRIVVENVTEHFFDLHVYVARKRQYHIVYIGQFVGFSLALYPTLSSIDDSGLTRDVYLESVAQYLAKVM